MKTVHHFCVVFPVVCALLFSCASINKPVDTTNRMWYKVVSPNILPDTLFYGQSAMFQVAIGDSSGDAATATVTGLPQGSYNITSDKDTAFVTLNITADSLQYDSLYTARIHARGGDPADTLSVSYSFLVVDSTRLGGLRKLAIGTWWITDENDSLAYHKDTAGIKLSIAKNDHRHKYSKVTFAGIIAGELYYGIETTDTVLSDSSQPTKSGMVLRHTASKVDYAIPPRLLIVNTDSVDVEVFKLPLMVGNSWEEFSVAGDTTVRIYIGTFPLVIGVELQLSLSESRNSSVAGISQYQFGGTSRTCYEVVSQSGMKADYLSDTTIGYLGTTIIGAGDTAVASDSACSVHSFVNNDLSIPLWSYSVGTKRDTNYVNKVVTRDTVRMASRLTTFFDARSGKTFTK